MTESAARTGAALRGGTIAWSVAAIFLVVLAALALRLHEGADPALRHLVARGPVRHVLVRRILERRVVVHLPSGRPAPAGSTSQQVLGSASFAPPVTRVS